MLERAGRGNEADGARPFSAFLSYSHADEAAARRLQEAIETYRVPSRIVGTNGPFGPVPARLKPVFRDRDELVAASNLEAALAEALRKADALIVLCSPAAVASEWVNREIALFHDLRGGSRIFAAFIDGEGEREIVPPALLERVGVPLAADFRPHGDGTRIARLKVIAALLGTSLGALEQRDTARRNRRLVWTALASLGVAVAFGVVAARAIRAEALARAEQARSERMVETLIADLREAVKPVGSLALLARVNETALAYYRGQNLAEMSEASLLQRARLLIAMGEDELARGNIGIARTHFAEAHRTTAARLQQAPRDPEARFDHGQSEFWVGYAAWLSGDPNGARRHFELYAALAEELVEEAPGEPRWETEAGHAAVNLGMLTLRQWGNGASAEARFRTAIAHFDAALAGDGDGPSLAFYRRNASAWLAIALRARGAFDAAREIETARLRSAERALSADVTDQKLLRERMLARIALLRTETEAGRPARALGHATPALADAETLARRDPDDAVAAEDLRMVRLFAARAALALPRSERPALPEVRAQIGPCAPPESRQGRREVDRYCDLVTARLWLAEGRAADARLLAIEARNPEDAPRLSETWGLDFEKEVREILTAS
jgi:tetratricopeptide (TPR) repeat protein